MKEKIKEFVRDFERMPISVTVQLGALLFFSVLFVAAIWHKDLPGMVFNGFIAITIQNTLIFIALGKKK